MSVFDKNRSANNASNPGSVFDRKPASSSPGSVFDRKPASSSPGSVFDRKPASNSPGSVFDKKPGTAPGPTSVFTNNELPEEYKKQKGVKYGAPIWTGPTPLKPGTKSSTKQSKTLLMMQQMIDDGEGVNVPNAFDQEKGYERSKYQRCEEQTTIDQQFYGRTGNEGLENSRFDPFREDYGPARE